MSVKSPENASFSSPAFALTHTQKKPKKKQHASFGRPASHWHTPPKNKKKTKNQNASSGRPALHWHTRDGTKCASMESPADEFSDLSPTYNGTPPKKKCERTHTQNTHTYSWHHVLVHRALTLKKNNWHVPSANSLQLTYTYFLFCVILLLLLLLLYTHIYIYIYI